MDVNKLYYGDCLTVMSEWPLACVDLIYLDPPFNSNRQYNAIYKDETGRPLPDQIEAFCDMWELDPERERVIRDMPILMRANGIDDSIVEFWRLWMKALRDTQPRLLAYLTYMAERLMIMKRILKPTGSVYLHCDPTASHYIKALMDAIFGHGNFRNEIVWKRTGAHNSSRRYGPVHDTILYYSRSDAYGWNDIRIINQEYVNRRYTYRDDRGRLFQPVSLIAAGTRNGASGLPWRGIDVTAKGNHWRYTVQRLDELDAKGDIYWPSRGNMPRLKMYADDVKGELLQDWWHDIPPVNSQAAERMGYNTQKPIALLERIVKASSNPGDVVLDPFAGCATTMEAAQKLGRKWIGIDIAIHAIKRVARVRLVERLGLIEGEDFEIEGVPRNVEGAEDLWERDKYHFQKWAVEQVEGFVTSRKTADGGIDGRLYFAVPDEKDLQSMVIEVKGGKNVNIRDLRALKGVLDNDEALMAGLITMRPLSERQQRNFNKFMAGAGSLNVLGIEYPRMQTLSVEEICDGARFNTPTVMGRHTQQPVLPGTPSSP